MRAFIFSSLARIHEEAGVRSSEVEFSKINGFFQVQSTRLNTFCMSDEKRRVRKNKKRFTKILISHRI